MNKLQLMQPDSASKMKTAYNILRHMNPKMRLITYHLLHVDSVQIIVQFPQVNDSIPSVKSATIENNDADL